MTNEYFANLSISELDDLRAKIDKERGDKLKLRQELDKEEIDQLKKELGNSIKRQRYEFLAIISFDLDDLTYLAEGMRFPFRLGELKSFVSQSLGGEFSREIIVNSIKSRESQYQSIADILCDTLVKSDGPIIRADVLMNEEEKKKFAKLSDIIK